MAQGLRRSKLRIVGPDSAADSPGPTELNAIDGVGTDVASLATSTRHSPSATTDSSWSRASTTTPALCSVSAVLITRIAACWRKGELYELRDEDGEAITEAEGKTACIDRFKIDLKVRAARRRNTPAKALKNRVAGRGRKESAQKVAPATDPPGMEASENVA
jgi:hypothetical protein